MEDTPIQEGILSSRISPKKINPQPAEKATSVLVGTAFVSEVLAILVCNLLYIFNFTVMFFIH